MDEYAKDYAVRYKARQEEKNSQIRLEIKRKQTLDTAIPGLWEQLRTWLIEMCARINAQFSEPILSVNKSHPSQLAIEQKNPSSKLIIEIVPQEHRFHLAYGRGCSGTLNVDTDEAGVVCVLDETGRRMYQIEEIGTKLMEMLEQSCA